MSACPSLKGWLMKQNHGLCRTWCKRYFVLQDRELAYYHHKDDATPQQVLDLSHYSISCKRHGRRQQRSFALISRDAQPNYYLQAEDEEDMDRWIQHLQQHMASSSSVLDKWLERLEITPADSCPSLPMPNTSHLQQQQQQGNMMMASKSGPGQLQPVHAPINTLHSHRSMESISTFASLPHRASFTNDRRPSTQSTYSNKSASSHTTTYTTHTTYSAVSSHHPGASLSTSTTTTAPSSISFDDATLPTCTTTSTTTNGPNHHQNGGAKFFPARFFSSSRKKGESPYYASPTTPLAASSSPMVASATAPPAASSSPIASPPATLSPCSAPATTLAHHQGDDANKKTDTQMLPFSTSSSSCSLNSASQQGPIQSIIHPSEYNHDDDPHERFLQRQQQKKQLLLTTDPIHHTLDIHPRELVAPEPTLQVDPTVSV